MRFQKSIRIAPGIRINLSKSGVGVRVGPRSLKLGSDGKGHHYSWVGIPGTGISQRNYIKEDEDGHTPAECQGAMLIGILIVVGVVLVVGLFAAVKQ
jgi:hypothetical protein